MIYFSIKSFEEKTNIRRLIKTVRIYFPYILCEWPLLVWVWEKQWPICLWLLSIICATLKFKFQRRITPFTANIFFAILTFKIFHNRKLSDGKLSRFNLRPQRTFKSTIFVEMKLAERKTNFSMKCSKGTLKKKHRCTLVAQYSNFYMEWPYPWLTLRQFKMT